MRTVNGVTEFYAYDSGDKLLAVTGGSDPRTFAYDAAGRTTGIVRSSGTTAFSYDYESRVASITKPGMTTNTFTYNGLDTRVGMVDSSGSKSFKRNGVDVTDPVLSDGTASFTPSGEVRGGVKTTFHSSLKNDDVQSSASQVIGEAKVFDAFGNELSSTGAWKSQFGYAGKFGYQGDADSGLKLLGHRYYHSSTGRFLTRDPIKDGRNWYSYCENSPVVLTDSDGQAPFLIVFAAVAIIAILSTGAAEAPSEPNQSYDREKFGRQKLEWVVEFASLPIGGPALKGGKLGKGLADDLVRPLKGGTHKPFEPRSTFRTRHWKKQASKPDAGEVYGSENLERMKRGRAPQRQRNGKMESMELSHEPKPYRNGGTDFIERWPDEHAAIDPHRHLGDFH